MRIPLWYQASVVNDKELNDKRAVQSPHARPRLDSNYLHSLRHVWHCCSLHLAWLKHKNPRTCPGPYLESLANFVDLLTERQPIVGQVAPRGCDGSKRYLTTVFKVKSRIDDEDCA